LERTPSDKDLDRLFETSKASEPISRMEHMHAWEENAADLLECIRSKPNRADLLECIRSKP